MTLSGPDSATIKGWDGLKFHFFTPNELQRFNSGKWQKAGVSADRPGVTEVRGGIVPGLKLSDTFHRPVCVGVFDSNGEPVVASIQFRGIKERSGDVLAPSIVANSKLDSRSAYYLGIDASRYGHFILETLCRAWAWDKYADCKVAIIQSPPLPAFVQAFLELIPGLASRIETVTQPTRFERLIVPYPGFAMGRVAHFPFKHLCEKMTDRALSKDEPVTNQPLYLSRAGLRQPSKRALIGEDRLERFLEQQGFLVIRPETLSVQAQIALFNRHRWIVLPNGSACHTRLFSRVETNMITLTTEQVKGTFILSDRLCQGESHYANVFTVPDLGHDVPHDTAQPVMLDEERFLSLLKQFGLIRSTASFSEKAPDIDVYKRQWLQFARSKRKLRFRSAIDQIAPSVEVQCASDHGQPEQPPLAQAEG